MINMTKIERKTPKEFKVAKPPSVQKQTPIAGTKELLQNFNSDIRTSKDIRFSANGRLQLPVFTSDPAIGEIGEIALIGGVVKSVTTTANTWVAV